MPTFTAPVISWFKSLQAQIVDRLQSLDGELTLTVDPWERPGGGGGISKVLTEGKLIEKGGVNFSHVMGDAMPAASTQSRPQLADRPFEAAGVSLVLHPQNPFVPCTHMNVRVFSTRDTDEEPVWWFGGGFDLTPVYPFLEDAQSWHAAARAACGPDAEKLYPCFKEACDRYFFLPHRNECRGVGGLFFDDFSEGGFAAAFALTRSIGEAFLPAWEAIAERRRGMQWGAEEKAFQRYRRGRYVEFNLLFDRGTRFGLESRGRTESILMSMPPQADWSYDFIPAPGSPEAKLAAFLKPRDWLSEEGVRELL
jgi:coproporphyrinogen III oxidase